MLTNDNKPGYELSLVCYPFYPTKDSGRGVDRYLHELLANHDPARDGLHINVIQQGRSVGNWASGVKLFTLLRGLASARSAVYHAVSPPAGSTALLAGKKNVVVNVHDLVPFHVQGYNPSFKLKYARWCTDVCVARAAALIVPFSVTRDELIAKHGADPSKIHVINYGVDHATYYPRPHVARNPRRVLYVGEVSRAKGVDVLLDAFAQLKAKVPDAQLLIGGKGKDQQLLQEQSRSLGLQDVEFRGFIPEAELAELYASAAVMVFPSRYGFGLSSLEAMACGTPAIVAATLDAPEFIEGAGVLVKVEDAADLAQKMEQVLTDAAFAADVSRKCIERAARYSWATTAAKTRAVCNAVARR